MFSYIKRHWPVYVILTLIAIALGFGAAYIVGAKGSTPASAISEEVEQEPVSYTHLDVYKRQPRYRDHRSFGAGQ